MLDNEKNKETASTALIVIIACLFALWVFPAINNTAMYVHTASTKKDVKQNASTEASAEPQASSTSNA